MKHEWELLLLTWPWTWQAGRFGPESRRRSHDASCAEGSQSPQIRGGHLPTTCGAWPAQCLVSCLSRTASQMQQFI